MVGSEEELRLRPVPRMSSCVGGCTYVQHALIVRGARHALGLAFGDSVHALQKSALPSTGAASQLCPPPPPLVPVPPRLAHTGADATSGVSAALTLLLSGRVLMLLGRSRRRKEIAR